MLTAELIRRKRDGEALSAAQIAAFVGGIVDGRTDAAQMGAMAMAIRLRGMQREEIAALTLAMRDSGDVLDLRPEAEGRPLLDKHSTGGVGDLVSLPLAPMLAACGAWVPMISGRGLGHTGGTLDKLEAIPGYRCQVERERFLATLRAAGCAIIGADGSLAPADARLYAVRDVTATVDSVALITASILSKKLAAGLDALVLDVKAGNGAQMPELAASRELAASLVAVAAAAGLPTTALITAMDQPLLAVAGNALETRAAIALLRGDPLPHGERLRELCRALGTELLLSGRLAGDRAQALQQLDASLSSGAAAERFARMVHALGGPADLLDDPDRYLPPARLTHTLHAARDGYLASYDTRGVGLAVIELGGGRHRAGETIDPAVGISGLLPIGTPVHTGDPIAHLHANDPRRLQNALSVLGPCIRVEDGPGDALGLVVESVYEGTRARGHEGT